MTQALAERLAGVVGPDHVLVDPAVVEGYVRDWTGRWRGDCALVVRPADEGQTAAVLAEVAAAGLRVVVQGGNTGLVAGGVPEAGDVLLSTTRLTRIGPVNPVAGTVVAEAGVTLAALQDFLRPHGLELPVDLAARESCTVGGMAATNAGGIRVLQQGMMRSQVLSVDALTVDGRPLVRMHPLVKDNTGYSLSALLVGSEGTLGVITRLLLRVVARSASRAVVLLGLPGVQAAVDVLAEMRVRVPQLRAAELVDDACLRLVLAATGEPDPLPRRHPAHLVLELADGPAGLDRLLTALAGAGVTDDPLIDLAAADDAAGVRRLWGYRDRITESVSAFGVPHKFDLSVPAARTAEFVERCGALVREWPTRDPLSGRSPRPFFFGHLGDGNVHVNILDADPRDDALDDAVLTLAAQHDGSISAEHGIGRAKAHLLRLNRTGDEVAAMLAVKRALDPDGRLGRALLPFDGARRPG
ncbi:FAD-binding oxidoreductase [Blastococcus mobilis]|uniref:FAD/FMN-containing dehydrogenase n=1 Tax=Blastococcus mobilis TaxID=1938746 RepID=A0A238X979_9ACTN|nr:FAD-binding oxidoreductase [Blastococcus mobilis]SNR55605.1 FAD/FMN-containing dehydrogenase [Blastococcus mobilis]